MLKYDNALFDNPENYLKDFESKPSEHAPFKDGVESGIKIELAGGNQRVTASLVLNEKTENNTILDTKISGEHSSQSSIAAVFKVFIKGNFRKKEGEFENKIKLP
jgi:hypothetical protein